MVRKRKKMPLSRCASSALNIELHSIDIISIVIALFSRKLSIALKTESRKHAHIWAQNQQVEGRSDFDKHSDKKDF